VISIVTGESRKMRAPQATPIRGPACSSSISTARPTPPRWRCFSTNQGRSLTFELHPVDTRKGEQFTPSITNLDPKAKVPVIVDDDGTAVFDSNAILLYLGEKTGKFMPPAKDRGAWLSWLMFVATGVGPFAGQAVHFKHMATEKVPYAQNRYQYEAARHFGVIEAHLANHRYMVGETYTIVDMALWGWTRMLPLVNGEEAWAKFPNLKRLTDEIDARPAAAKAATLKDKFTFKATMDDEARTHMLRHLERNAA